MTSLISLLYRGEIRGSETCLLSILSDSPPEHCTSVPLVTRKFGFLPGKLGKQIKFECFCLHDRRTFGQASRMLITFFRSEGQRILSSRNYSFPGLYACSEYIELVVGEAKEREPGIEVELRSDKVKISFV